MFESLTSVQECVLTLGPPASPLEQDGKKWAAGRQLGGVICAVDRWELMVFHYLLFEGTLRDRKYYRVIPERTVMLEGWCFGLLLSSG